MLKSKLVILHMVEIIFYSNFTYFLLELGIITKKMLYIFHMIKNFLVGLWRIIALFYFPIVQKLYNEMEKRIEDATKLKRVPQEARSKHRGFSQWDSYSSKRDHDTILQVNCLIQFTSLVFPYPFRRDHGTINLVNAIFYILFYQILLHKKDPDNSKDVHRFMLPTLVYLAREKRPQYHHNYKAGAMNSLVYITPSN